MLVAVAYSFCVIFPLPRRGCITVVWTGVRIDDFVCLLELDVLITSCDEGLKTQNLTKNV